jgi:DNA repair protein RecN (Recombination protein N)
MLTRLSVSQFVLIDQLTLEFQKGLTVLTGETGAGKSILLDALGLALGHRADPALIRVGQEMAQVTAEFNLAGLDPDHGVFGILQEAGLEVGTELIMRRSLSRDSKSKCFLNDMPVTLGLIKSIGIHLMDVHGQNEDILAPSAQLKCLDNFALAHVKGFYEAQQKYASHFSDFQNAQKEYDAFSERLKESSERQGYYQFVLKELEPLAPKKNEESELLEARENYLQGSKGAEMAQNILENLGANALTGFYAAHRSLEKWSLSSIKPIADAFTCLDRALIDLEEFQRSLNQIVLENSHAKAELARLDDRLQELRLAAKKFGVEPGALEELLSQARMTNKSSIDLEDERLRLEKQVQNTQKIAWEAATELSLLRREGARILEEAITQELPDLKLEHARLKIEVGQGVLTSSGADTVGFLVAMNKGQPLSPLHKTASGGEMARLTLALKVTLGASVPMMIFDEIDQGVSGAVATAIGKRLRRLGEEAQVLVITHSAQVAALGHHHFKVFKTVEAEGTTTSVKVIDEPARAEEIARLLAGDEVTEEARLAAKVLLR